MSSPGADKASYDELCAYTLAHRDPSFIHQLVVDAYTAQHADESTKPIPVAFALAGLYLHCDRGFSGKQVQRVHMLLARRKRPLPSFALPGKRGVLTAIDVMAAPPGPDRDRAIDEWCRSVWLAWRDSHGTVADWLQKELGA